MQKTTIWVNSNFSSETNSETSNRSTINPTNFNIKPNNPKRIFLTQSPLLSVNYKFTIVFFIRQLILYTYQISIDGCNMFDERFKELRKNRGFNQVEIANIFGVTKQCVSNWENGNIMPSIEILIKISRFFSVSTDFLLGISSNHVLKTDGLSESEIAHIQMIINDISGSKNK